MSKSSDQIEPCPLLKCVNLELCFGQVFDLFMRYIQWFRGPKVVMIRYRKQCPLLKMYQLRTTSTQYKYFTNKAYTYLIRYRFLSFYKTHSMICFVDCVFFLCEVFHEKHIFLVLNYYLKLDSAKHCDCDFTLRCLSFSNRPMYSVTGNPSEKYPTGFGRISWKPTARHPWDQGHSDAGQSRVEAPLPYVASWLSSRAFPPSPPSPTSWGHWRTRWTTWPVPLATPRTLWPAG